MKNSTYFDILNINTLQKPSPIEVSSCYIIMSVGLITTITLLGRQKMSVPLGGQGGDSNGDGVLNVIDIVIFVEMVLNP